MTRRLMLLTLLSGGSVIVVGCGSSEAPAPDPTLNPVIKAASSKPAGSKSEAKKASVND